MTAEDAEGVGLEAASSKHGNPAPGTPTRLQVAVMLFGDDRVREGVLQLQDMRNVNQNCILASALCFAPSLQDHFSSCQTGHHRGQCDPLSNIAGSTYITFV